MAETAVADIDASVAALVEVDAVEIDLDEALVRFTIRID